MSCAISVFICATCQGMSTCFTWGFWAAYTRCVNLQVHKRMVSQVECKCRKLKLLLLTLSV